MSLPHGCNRSEPALLLPRRLHQRVPRTSGQAGLWASELGTSTSPLMREAIYVTDEYYAEYTVRYRPACGLLLRRGCFAGGFEFVLLRCRAFVGGAAMIPAGAGARKTNGRQWFGDSLPAVGQLP